MPGPAAELMFAPLELGFPVDATPLGRVRRQPRSAPPGRQAQSRRRSDRPRGSARAITAPRSRAPSARTAARELEAVLGGRRPAAAAALSALLSPSPPPTTDELEERRRAPARELRAGRAAPPRRASSTASSSPRFPPRPSRCPSTRSTCCPTRSGRWCPHAISHAGSRIGPYIGHTADRLAPAGAVRPRRGPPGEPAADLSRRRHLGSGKTVFLRARRLAGLPAGLADRRHRPQGRSPPRARCPASPERIEEIELSGEERYRGLLDPMRIGHRGDPRGPHLQLSDLDPAGAGHAGVADAARASPSPRRSAPAPAAAARCCGCLVAVEDPDARRSGRQSRSTPQRPRPARPRRRQRRPCPRSAPPRSSPCRSRNLALPLAGTAARRSCSRRSGSASPCCACSPPTRCGSARPTSTATRCSRLDEAWVLSADSAGPRAVGADQPHGPLAEHHPDPRHADVRRRGRARTAGRGALRLRRRDRGARRARPSRCCASTPTTRPRSAASWPTAPAAATCATSGPGRAGPDRAAPLAVARASTRRPRQADRSARRWAERREGRGRISRGLRAC